MLRPGDAAPDFVLKDASGSDLRLSNFSGRPIIVCFLKGPSNRMCHMVVAGLKAQRDAFDGLDAAVVSIAMGRPEELAPRNGDALAYPVLADPDGRVRDLYDAWHTSLFGKRAFAARRCTYLIDEDGIIRKTYANVNVLTHAKQLLKDVQRMKAQRSWGKKDARMKDLMP